MNECSLSLLLWKHYLSWGGRPSGREVCLGSSRPLPTFLTLDHSEWQCNLFGRGLFCPGIPQVLGFSLLMETSQEWALSSTSGCSSWLHQKWRVKASLALVHSCENLSNVSFRTRLASPSDALALCLPPQGNKVAIRDLMSPRNVRLK